VPGELRPVVVSFNRVLELLHDAAAAQQRFVADAAHQMRTPVAGLLAQLELLLREPRAAGVAAELATLQRGIQHLAHSANQLLSLARAEPIAALPEDLKPIALEQLVEQLIERHLDRADQGGIDLGAEAAPAQALGDAWLLEDLLGNLIDNALKYTPSGGHVTVRSGMEGRAPYLEVEDDGPGIPEAERARVRERFYRLPGSLGMGCGLGLAIVDEIARVHGATLSIGSGPQGRGTRMRVRFGAAK
jgi:two-component system sensor histidine kinase TctE